MLIGGERPAQLGRQAQAGDGQDLVEPLEAARRHARRLDLEPARQIAQQPLGLAGIADLPGLPESTADSGVMLGLAPVGDVAGLVDLAALDRDVGP